MSKTKVIVVLRVEPGDLIEPDLVGRLSYNAATLEAVLERLLDSKEAHRQDYLFRPLTLWRVDEDTA